MKLSSIFLFFLTASPVFANNYAITYDVTESNCVLQYTKEINEALVDEGLLPPEAEVTTTIETSTLSFTTTLTYSLLDGVFSIFGLSWGQRRLKGGRELRTSVAQVCARCELKLPNAMYCKVFNNYCVKNRLLGDVEELQFEERVGYVPEQGHRKEFFSFFRWFFPPPPPPPAPTIPEYWKNGATAAELDAATANVEQAVNAVFTQGECSNEIFNISYEFI